MDVGAFLQAGRLCSVLFEDESDPARPPVSGTVTARRGRPFWSAAEPLVPGRRLSLTLHLKGFVLDDDDSLSPAGPDDLARLTLAGRLLKCRYFALLDAYALRLDLTGRVL